MSSSSRQSLPSCLRRRRSPCKAVSSTFANGSVSAIQARGHASWWCRRTFATANRRCFIFRPTCPIRAIRNFPKRPPSASGACSISAVAAPSASLPATRRCAISTSGCCRCSIFPILLHGTAPRKALLEEFRVTPNAVLFGTSSFWQGVDVQGEALSCVIIDQLPFAVPNDPVVQARMKAIEEAGGKPFFDYQVPSAVLTLKQGFGRLIRSLEDRGVLVLLDPRIRKQRYGQTFLNSLPPYRMTTTITDVEKFFEVPSEST